MASKNGKGKDTKMTAQVETQSEVETTESPKGTETTRNDFKIVSERSKTPVENTVEILKQVSTQKQSFLNLDTFENDTIEVKQCRFIPQEYDADIHGSRENYDNAVFEAAKSLVQPAEKQTQALLEFAQSEVYYNSKRDALAAGNFMSPELKSQLVKMMKMRPAFADESSAKVFERWEVGFKAKNPKAIEFLDQAKAALVGVEEEDFGF